MPKSYNRLMSFCDGKWRFRVGLPDVSNIAIRVNHKDKEGNLAAQDA